MVNEKWTMVIFFIFVHKNVYRIGLKEIKIRPLEVFESGPLFSLFLMRKRLSSGQKWFLRQNFPLIRGMFVLRSGPRAMGAVTLRILELCLSFYPHPNISDGNSNLIIFMHLNIPDNKKRPS